MSERRELSIERRGDVVYTPEWVARDMCEHFQPSGRVLEPCRGAGVFMPFLPANSEWCEITEGRDFFAWTEPVDWVVSNPPYSMTRPWFKHSYDVAENLLYLVPLRNVFSGYGFIKEIYEFGGIKEIRLYGTGGKLGFPMGNAVGALHVVRSYDGPTVISFHDQPQRRLSASNVILIARCPTHGLHGERTECFVCGGPVEQVPFVEVAS